MSLPPPPSRTVTSDKTCLTLEEYTILMAAHIGMKKRMSPYFLEGNHTIHIKLLPIS